MRYTATIVEESPDMFFNFVVVPPPKTFKIVIEIDEASIDDIRLPLNNPMIKCLQNDLKETYLWNEPENGKLGFGAFFSVKNEGPKVLISAEMPKLTFQPTDECPECYGTGLLKDLFCINCMGSGRIKKICKECKGTGKDQYDLRSECIFCDGSGFKRSEIDWQQGNLVIANLHLIFSFLNAKVDEMKQTLNVIIYFNKDPYSVDINGRINTLMQSWLEPLNSKDLSSIVKKMKKIYGYLTDRPSPDDISTFGFAVDINPKEGAFHLQCPGDRTCIHSYGAMSELYSHNVDNPIQVITLLTGLLEMDRLATS